MKFELSSPIDYQHKGENKKGMWLELAAPANKHRKRIARLQQGFYRAMMDMQSKVANTPKKTSKGDDELGAFEIMMVLKASSEPYDDYVEEFAGLMAAGVCKIEDECEMTTGMVDAMSSDDFEKLMGEYLANFTLGSFADMMKKG